MKVKKESELTDIDLVTNVYQIISQKLEDTINTLSIENEGLINHLNHLQKLPIPRGVEMFRLDQKHKRDYMDSIKKLKNKIDKLSIFRKKLLEKDDCDNSFLDIQCEQDIKNHLMHMMDRVMRDEYLLTDFINDLSDSIILDDPKNFYTLMCTFLLYSLDIKTFSVHSKMAIVLTNNLFDVNIKNKHTPTSTEFSISLINPHYTAKQKRS